MLQADFIPPMAVVLNMNLIIIVLITAMVVTCSALAASILIGCFNPRKVYGWLRFSMCGVGILFCTLMSFSLFLRAAFWKGGSPFTESELSELRMGVAVLAIPMVVGLLAAVGMRNRFARKIGNGLVFVISPAVIVLVNVIEPSLITAFTPWLCTATVVSMVAWRILLLGSREDEFPTGEPAGFNNA